MHGLGYLKVRRLGLAPVLLQFHCHILIEPLNIDAAHFKTEGKRLVVPGLFIALLIGNACRAGKISIPCAVDKGPGLDGCQSGNGLDNAGHNLAALHHGIHHHRLEEDIHACFSAHLIINKRQGLRIVPGLLRHAIKWFNTMLAQSFLDLRHIRGVTVRGMSIHKRINASQHRQSAKGHAPLNQHGLGIIPGCHDRCRRA